MIYIPCSTTDCKHQESERMSCNEPKRCCIKEGKCQGYEPKPKEIEKIDDLSLVTQTENTVLYIRQTRQKLNELVDAVNELRRNQSSSNQ